MSLALSRFNVMLHLQIRYQTSHRTPLAGGSNWQPYGDGTPVPAGLAVVSLISPPSGAELRVLNACGEALSLETLRIMTLQPILGQQLPMFTL